MLECIQSSLNKIKDKCLNLNEQNLIDYLENYQDDIDLSTLLEVLRKMNYDEINSIYS
jgi:hypothetical protein